MTRMTRPDCTVMCNLINTHTHTHNMPPREGQCEFSIIYLAVTMNIDDDDDDDSPGLREYVQFHTSTRDKHNDNTNFRCRSLY